MSRPGDDALVNQWAMAACYSTDDDGTVQLPFDSATGELIPEVWERWLRWYPVRMARTDAGRAALRSQRAFYIEAIGRFGEPVLDVACGTGRLLLDYLGEGIDIDGVDVSDDMLELCRAKAPAFGLQPRLYRQGMYSLDLPRRYRSIIVPSSSFQLLLDPAAAREAMGRFFVHLEPPGALVMPFIVFGAADEAGVEFVREKV